MKHVIPEHEAGERIDAWLAQQDEFALPAGRQVSRTQAQKLIKNGGVTINGRLAKAGHVLKAEDEVEITDVEDTAAASSASAAIASGVKVVDETADFLVIEKPSGLLVHPAPNQKTGTLIDFLLAHDPSIKKVGEAPERPGIVHRLDREASGLMVVAKTQKAFEYLKKQFQKHQVKKEYLALVHGKVSKDFGTIETSIGRKKGKGRMSARSQPMEGDKDAVSHYDVLERFPHASLVKVRTETGRMHQVRVHMKSLSHPLVGDDLYAGAQRGHTLKAPRLFLHAATLGFTAPDGTEKAYASELPADLSGLLETLRKKHAKK